MLDDFFADVSKNYREGLKKGSLCRRLDLFRDDFPKLENELESYEANYRILKDEYRTINCPNGIFDRFAFSFGEIIGYGFFGKK